MQPIAAKIPGIGAMALIVSSLAVLTPSVATANVVAGSDSAFGVSVNLNLTLIGSNVGAVIGPLPTLANTAPAPHNVTTNTASVNASAGTFGLLGANTVADVGTGLITLTTTSNVDGSLGPKFATGQSTVNNLGVGLINLPPVLGIPVADLLGISATTISSTATVSGDYGSLVGVGSSTVENLQLQLSGLPILNLTGTINPAPNTNVTLLTPVAGLSVILNEQIPTFTGGQLETRSLTVNAVHIILNALNVPGLGSLTGDIIIGQSRATLQATPEPSSVIMLGLSLSAIAGPALLRRRRAKAANSSAAA